MRSASDLTAAATIRDTAMRLFAERGAASVTVRDIATAANVSPALVIHHYKSKDGLRAVVEQRAVQLLTDLAGEFPEPSAGVEETTSMAVAFVERLEAHPALLGYLRRMLVDGGPSAQVLVGKLYELTAENLARSEAAGLVRASSDPAARAMYLLASDLAVLVLREQIATVLGADPLGRAGIVRWTEQLVDIYQHGVYRPGEDQHA